MEMFWNFASWVGWVGVAVLVVFAVWCLLWGTCVWIWFMLGCPDQEKTK